MQWHRTVDGKTVGLLKHFLENLSLAGKSPGQRAETFNAMLRDRGCSGKLYEARLKNKCGRAPWVATKDAYRAVYNFLQA